VILDEITGLLGAARHAMRRAEDRGDDQQRPRHVPQPANGRKADHRRKQDRHGEGDPHPGRDCGLAMSEQDRRQGDQAEGDLPSGTGWSLLPVHSGSPGNAPEARGV
jgi:hypothetical protein